MSKIEEACGTTDSELQGQECMLFSGTAIANGSCSAVVTAIGMSTEMGRIQADITAAAAEDADTPLKKKLNDFGNLLAKVCHSPWCFSSAWTIVTCVCASSYCMVIGFVIAADCLHVFTPHVDLTVMLWL